ncbi:Hsp20/alpha crystallin family protein [Thalassospira xiamenensis]|jgi:HSP20 family protein|uniref:HSP20 family protein n=1 Tax=Thalassospira xiamenensis TaxID=220697 RepID=A0A154KVJ1_9PROT|nr:Hsp20/alpha crystallin family protein [Thalassospira xiamenensis]KZB54717.1 heat-shock protein Hsp20 [Thalassospira xiamenensis]MCK2168956.1 Hsp20/alpha crystallin family protein [Thalassospira xiamenensis]RCK51026.1 heat-shock protein Hsp20 [Thalassospira xiamenensis]SOC23810.1 HSP20 family protein [Thalassospira xiamenensis]
MTGLQTVNGTARRLASRPAYGDPFGVFGRDFDRMIGSIFGRDGLVNSADTNGNEAPQKLLTPRIDVHETDDNIELSAELPGVEQGDVDVSVLEGVLTITGEKKSTRESNDGARVVERTYGSFKRSFRLPDTVDADKIAASFKNGVLTLTLPKVAEVKPEPRKIAISG